MKLLTLLSSVVLAGVAGVATAAGPDVKAGQWEMTMTTKIEGLPMQMPPQTATHRQCLTEKDVKENKWVPQNPQDPECKLEDLRLDGNKVSWKVDCPKSKTSGTGELTHLGSSYEGVMKMTSAAGGQTMKIRVDLKGKRTGDCK